MALFPPGKSPKDFGGPRYFPTGALENFILGHLAPKGRKNPYGNNTTLNPPSKRARFPPICHKGREKWGRFWGFYSILGQPYTFIDEQKIPSLDWRWDGFKYGSGEIRAYTAHASSLVLQDIELKNFKLTVAPFSQNGLDGLLGMNFFEKFDFKIDQITTYLYLKLNGKRSECTNREQII